VQNGRNSPPANKSKELPLVAPSIAPAASTTPSGEKALTAQNEEGDSDLEGQEKAQKKAKTVSAQNKLEIIASHSGKDASFFAQNKHVPSTSQSGKAVLSSAQNKLVPTASHSGGDGLQDMVVESESFSESSDELEESNLQEFTLSVVPHHNLGRNAKAEGRRSARKAKRSVSLKSKLHLLRGTKQNPPLTKLLILLNQHGVGQ